MDQPCIIKMLKRSNDQIFLKGINSKGKPRPPQIWQYLFLWHKRTVNLVFSNSNKEEPFSDSKDAQVNQNIFWNWFLWKNSDTYHKYFCVGENHTDVIWFNFDQVTWLLMQLLWEYYSNNIHVVKLPSSHCWTERICLHVVLQTNSHQFILNTTKASKLRDERWKMKNDGFQLKLASKHNRRALAMTQYLYCPKVWLVVKFFYETMIDNLFVTI